LERSNQHPADKLAMVRSRIKELELEEEQLRNWLLAHPDDCTGFDFAALISTRSTRRIDAEALRRHVSAEIVAKCTVSNETTHIRLRELAKA
jgi:hypothetical protein